MPVVTFQRPDLCRIIGQDVPMAQLSQHMPMVGGDLDKVEGEAITIEWFPDRPDLLTLEGTGRAMRAFLGVRPGLATYEVTPAHTQLRVDASVASVRPYAALCFARGVPMDESYVQAIIDSQEKFTLSPGRKRRKIAIGIHDARDVQGPFTYTCVGPDAKPFEPLAWDEVLTPAQIIAQHPKGREYGHLLPDDTFPVFLDASGEVLSMPPIINAARTTVTTATRDLLIDVTGTDAATVRATIALLATSFAERGASIEAVTVHDDSGTWTSPDLTPAEHVLHTDDVKRLLGIDLSGDEVAAALQRMGHGAEAFGNKVLIQVPAWRFDILHPVDLMEDVAIGFGFENFPGHLPSGISFGGALASQAVEDRARSVLTGLGWSEARTLTLTNAKEQWGDFGQPVPAAVTVANPVLEDRTLLRQRIMPGLLSVLAANRHRSMPQRLFEIGYVVVDVGGEWRNRMHLGVVETSARAGFSDAKGLAEALLRDLGIDARLEPASEPGFIAGRQGRILLHDVGDDKGADTGTDRATDPGAAPPAKRIAAAGSTRTEARAGRAHGTEDGSKRRIEGDSAGQGRVVGHFGELHPDTLVAAGLGAATIVLELDLHALHR